MRLHKQSIGRGDDEPAALLTSRKESMANELSLHQDAGQEETDSRDGMEQTPDRQSVFPERADQACLSAVLDG